MTIKRILGIAAGLAASMAIGLGSAAAADQASLRLNWQLLGFHAPFYYGVEKGFYRDEGIDLTINEGRGGAATAQALGANGDTFGIVDAGTLIVAASKGLPIKTVMSLMNSGIFAVVAREDANIKTAKDLEGKTISITAGDALTALFPAVVAANKLDASKIKLVNVDAAAKVVAVLEKRADATLGSVDAQSFVMEAQGVPASVMAFDDLGVSLVGLTVITNNQTAEKSPDLVKRFARATQKTFAEAKKDPEGVIAAALKSKPVLDAKILRQQMDVSLAKMESPNTKGKPIGAGSEADWANTLSLLKTYQGVETDKPATAFFTNAFVE
ncbi:ABC transporter substrate-binding protein [Chelatococcus asaccharovorans]|uniref:ABC transporter substrate-binding protein n=1 Tax=Chelatococcus asaccharovorans TaxID=28210 RepID=UPI00224C6849|nr:ABC transporter substrate-binding protein [Chelatococcus asaccharovorans]CAH1654491.1 NitT/TauT family transport system substrate-binding protein [Chelatococcus asaccharovorans]CAH1690770.1 NitT/TauT family transport system substrate-binding protein [Chelatococcus asaccharovorans]